MRIGGFHIPRSLIATAIALGVFIVAWRGLRVTEADPMLRFHLVVIAPCDDSFEMFYRADTAAFTAGRSVAVTAKASLDPQELVFALPADPGSVERLRIDPGNQPLPIRLIGAMIEGRYRSVHLDAQALDTLFNAAHDIAASRVENNALVIESTGIDPYLVSHRDLSPLILHALSPMRPVLWPLGAALAIAAVCFIVSYVLLRSRIPLRRRWAIPSLMVKVTTSSAFLLLIDAFIFFGLVGLGMRIETGPRSEQVRFKLRAAHDDTIQLLGQAEAQRSHEAHLQSERIVGINGAQWVAFDLPVDTPAAFLRIDPGSSQDSLVLEAMEFRNGTGRLAIPMDTVLASAHTLHDIDTCYVRGNELHLVMSGSDPYITFNRSWRSWMDAAADNTRRDLLVVVLALLIAIVSHKALATNRRLIHAWRSVSGRDALLVLSFIAMLFFPLLTVLHPRLDPPQPYTEKRILASMPDAARTRLDSFPDLYETYYKDNFGARRTLFRWNSLFHAEVLRTSPLSDRVIFGKGDWLYMVNQHVLHDHRGLPLFTFAELEKLRERVEQRRDELARSGVLYYLLVAPQKSAIYPEYLPARFRHAPAGRWLEELVRHFARYSDVALIDVRDELRTAKAGGEVYYHTDMHWTRYGAYFAYRALLARIAQDDPAVGSCRVLDDFEVRKDTNTGADLAMLIGLNDRMTRVTSTFIPLREQQAASAPMPRLPYREYMHADPETFTVADTTKPRLLMFHDSFALYLRPLLAEHFSRSTFIWTEHFIPEVVTREKPDVVVQEIMEMFIPDMLHDLPSDDPPHRVN